MKILWVLENYHPKTGGVETLFKSLEGRLLQNGHSLVVLTTGTGKKEVSQSTPKNIRIIRFPFSNRFLFTFLAAPIVWWHALKSDLVHTTSYNAGLPAIIGAKFAGKKVLITFHEVWGKLWFQLPFLSRLQARLYYSFEQLLLRLPYVHFVAVSNSTKLALTKHGIHPDRIEMIYNGIDYAEFPPTKSPAKAGNSFTMTYFGRLGVSKGLDLLLPAFARISQECPHCRLRLIIPPADGQLLRWIHSFVGTHGLEDRVELLHNLDFKVLQQKIQEADAVVIPSYSEGFCFAAVETIALGTPLISSGQAALEEVIGGKFVEMEEMTVNGLVAAMRKAIQGEWQEREARHFHLADTVARYEELYLQLLK